MITTSHLPEVNRMLRASNTLSAFDVWTLEPFDIKPDDQVVGHPHRHVSSVILSGIDLRWHVLDQNGLTIVGVKHGDRIQILRRKPTSH